jgi:hypothetical protein
MQCNWCGKSYTNGYGGGYCSRRCYEEGHRRTCKGCGQSFTGSGYSGTGFYSGAGGEWGSEVCYQKNASPGEKKVDAAAAKIVWTIILCVVFPPLLFVLYWRQVLFVLRLLYRLIFSRIFWKYILPGVVIFIACIMYVAHINEVESCETEMTQYIDFATKDLQKKIDALTHERIVYLNKIKKQREQESQKRAAEIAQQKAELDASIAAAKAELKRKEELYNINVYAKAYFKDKFERQQILDAEIKNVEGKISQYKQKKKTVNSELETEEDFIKLLLQRNRLILERRTIENAIITEYRTFQQEKGAQK